MIPCKLKRLLRVNREEIVYVVTKNIKVKGIVNSAENISRMKFIYSNINSDKKNMKNVKNFFTFTNLYINIYTLVILILNLKNNYVCT